jgi:hypothetical protein
MDWFLFYYKYMYLLIRLILLSSLDHRVIDRANRKIIRKGNQDGSSYTL